jgi:hypothetical protein
MKLTQTQQNETEANHGEQLNNLCSDEIQKKIE